MAETKYGKYIVTEMKPDLKLPSFSVQPEESPAGRATRVLYLDNEVIKGAFYVSCSWFWRGNDWVGAEAHTHDFDEVITFFGTNPEDPWDLCGEIELWLGDERHMLTKTCMVFVPKGLKHCPLIIRRADRPIFHFTAGPSNLYR